MKHYYTLNKIIVNNHQNKKIYDSLNSLFYDENKYFDTKINGNEVVIGKKIKNYNQDFLTQNVNLFDKKKTYSSKKLKKLLNSTYNSNKSFKSLKTYQNKFTVTNSLNNSQLKISTCNEINEKEINNLYKKYVDFKNNNNKNSLLKEKNKSFTSLNKLNDLRLLKIQEKAIKLNNKYFNDKEIIEKKILKHLNNINKIKNDNYYNKIPFKSLMNRIGCFREIKEFKENNEKELNNDMNNNIIWLKSLRMNNNLKTRNKSLPNIFINIGSNEKPIGQMIYFGKSKENSDTNKNEEKIFQNENYENEKKSFIKNLNIDKKDLLNCNSLKIKGTNLLNFEFNLIKQFKGKKLLHKFHYNPNEKENIIFKSQSSTYINNKYVLDNCRKIHENNM